MIEFSDEQRSRLLGQYAVANTPAYLLRALRADPAVQALAARKTPSELVDFIIKIDELKPRDAADVAVAYAAVAAMSLQSYRDVKAALPFPRIRSLSWVVPMFEIWDATRRSTNVFEFDAPMNVAPSAAVSSTSNTVTAGFDLATK